jgi:hypothetical protein
MTGPGSRLPAGSARCERRSASSARRSSGLWLGGVAEVGEYRQRTAVVMIAGLLMAIVFCVAT